MFRVNNYYKHIPSNSRFSFICKRNHVNLTKYLASPKKCLKKTGIYHENNIGLHANDLDICGRCLKNNISPIIHQYSRISSATKMMISNQLSREFRATASLLQRSGFSPHISSLYRGIHTSAVRMQQKPPDDDGNKKQDDDDKKVWSIINKALMWMVSGYMLIGLISLLFPSNGQPEQIIRYVSWNEFVYHMLAKGEVEQIIVRPDIDIVTIILHDGAVIKGRKMEHRTFHMNIVDIQKFEEKLREAEQRLGVGLGGGVPVVYERGSDALGKLVTTLILAALLLSLFNRVKISVSPGSLNYFSQLGRAKFTLVDPVAGQGKGVRFADVAGLQEAKQEVMEFVDYLKRPQFYRSLGAKVPRGALLLGPPGCGKTLLAKAVATEANVPFLSMNGSEFIEMIGGLGAARVRDLFKEGRKRSPCIIYIDEIDAIGRKRSGGELGDVGTGEGEQTLNQLLVEMDGMASKEGVIMLASTNRADVLDKALLRPGRFDRHILIDLPTLEERKQIFETHLKGITLEKQPSTYSHRMAYLTPGFSGADIANVCNEAALHAARSKQHHVKGADLEYAVERVVGGTEKRSHAMSPAEKRVVAYHESGHAIVGWMLPTTDALLKVTIVPRTNMALGFAQYTPKDQKLYSKEEIFDRMCMALGGRVAESLTFNKITSGAQNDLQKVRQMAYAMVREYGMSEEIGLISFEDDKNSIRPFSKKLAAMFDDEVRRVVARAYQHTEKVIKENKDKLELLAETLLKKETLNYVDVEFLIGPPPHGKKNLMDPADFEASVRHAVGSAPPPQPPSLDSSQPNT